jgi:hypothetical protein
MDDKNQVSPHYWLLALAIAVLATVVTSAWEFSQLESGLGILAIADQKRLEEITTLRQDLASQRETIEALKAQVTGATHAPAAAAPAAAAPESAAAGHAAKGKPHR